MCPLQTPLSVSPASLPSTAPMSDDLDSLAGKEQAKLQARVREFQAEMTTQAQLQQAITDINANCFTMVTHNNYSRRSWRQRRPVAQRDVLPCLLFLQCVTDVSGPGGLTSSERTCVKQCTARYIDTMQTMMQLFAKKK